MSYLIKSGSCYVRDASNPRLGRTVWWVDDPACATLFENRGDAAAFLAPFGWSLNHRDFKLVPAQKD